MSARGRLATPMPNSNLSRGMTDAPRGTRLAAPLSSHKPEARRRAGGDGDGGSANWKAFAPATACRVTDTARLEKPTIASTLRAASNRSKVMAQKAANVRKPRPPFGGGGGGDRKYPDKLSIPVPKQSPQRKSAGGVPAQKKEKPDVVQNEAQPPPTTVVRLQEIGVQTDEAEILNRELLVGDIKLLMPSAQITEKIDNMRWEAKNKLERQAMRKFAAHEQNEEQHLDELKQFTEHSYVTKRTPKKPPSLNLATYEQNQYRNVFKYMDEFLTHDVRKAESITDIKERIKRKETELMSMFDKVDIHDKEESDFDDE